MFAKIAVVCALVAIARAGVLQAGVSYAAPALAYGGAVRATPVYRQAPALAYGGGLGYAHGGLSYAAAAPAYAHAVAPAYAHAVPQLLAAPAIKVAAPIVTKTIVEAPQPYEFGYSHHTDDGASSSRHESSDANNAKHGSYSIENPDGTYRHVEYVADALGFRATIKTNEHGTAPQNPAATQVLAQEPPYKVLPAPAPIVKAVHAVHAAPVVAKAIHAAPIYAQAAAPVYAHAAPAYAHAAPVYAHAAPAYAHAAPAYYHH